MNNDITDVPGIRVGHAHDVRALTGCTVVLCEKGATAGVAVLGSAPGTRETDLLRPENLVGEVHAVLLSGGSAFGLDAASGVMRYLDQRGVGFQTGFARVPIVPAAVIYDLGIGDPAVRPDLRMGLKACANASTGPVELGSVGVGLGATVGKAFGAENMMKGGVGSASGKLGSGITVAALVAVNCYGDVYDPSNGAFVAGSRVTDGAKGKPKDSSGQNTTIGVVALDARLDKAAATKIAQMAHDGLARTIKPVHTMFDGDTVFCLATGEHGPKADAVEISLLGAMAAEVMEQAVLSAVLSATSVGTIKCAADIMVR